MSETFDGSGDFSKTRDRTGALQGQRPPASDLSWPVAGEVYKPNPAPIAGPGELAPCNSDMYGGGRE